MTPAVDQLADAGVAHRVVTYDHDADAESYGLEAAEMLDLDPQEVFKTLLARLIDGRHVVAVVPVTTQLSLKALARAAGVKKAQMADPRDAERITGYVVGGISPFGQRTGLETFLDQTALLLETINVSGGRRGVELAVAPDDLVAVLDATVVPLTA